MQYNCIGHKKLKFVPYSNIHPATITQIFRLSKVKLICHMYIQVPSLGWFLYTGLSLTVLED